VLESARGLSAHQLAAIADLQARTVAHDGGRLKLEWGTLRERPDTEVHDVLWWNGDRLEGFVGLYAFGPPTVELAGMVAPSARRHGIATTLLAAALDLARERRYDRALLVTPRPSQPGHAFARGLGATLDHSEHALALEGPPSGAPSGVPVGLRPATADDIDGIDALLSRAFGHPAHSTAQHLQTDTATTLVIEFEATRVGTMRVTREDGVSGIYGFAVDPSRQGHGIGREALRQACARLRTGGAQRIALEVAVDNEHALGLYTSLGFSRVTTEDYYALDLTELPATPPS
jgi:ribosomal protein S18 acetylase RimI-like enzyme